MGAFTWLPRGLAALLIVGTAPLAAQGVVEGVLQLDGESVPITHVYARESVPRSGGGERGHVIILMTDRPAPPDVRASRQAYYAAAREGRIRGVLLVLEPDPRFVLFAPGDAVVDTSVPDIFERLTLSGLRREGGTVAGRLQMSEPGDLSFGQDGAPATYRVNLDFSAPIAPAPQPTATLTGAAARSSPQAIAALRALRIIHTGSAAEVRAALHPSHPAWSGLSGDESEAILEVARQVLPAPATFLESIQQIVVYDDSAVILARDAEGETTVSLRRDGNEWKPASASIPND